jgi:hypothetical protein
MWQLFPKRIVLGLAALLVGGLCTVSLEAQPPGKGKGPKGRSGPPPDAEFMTMRGTVKEFTTAPKGEVDGLVLTDGKWVHWPPHLESRFKDIAAKGDRVRASGYWETGPAGDTKLEVSSLTNLDTDKSAENPDRPPPADARRSDAAAPRAGEALTVRGTVKEVTTAPKGEVDGVILTDGKWVHWPPHLEARFRDIAAKGDRIRATGYWETGPKGDTKLEVSTLTNLASNKTGENPDRPMSGPARLFPGKAGGVEERLDALEDQLDQLRREIQRLRREK